MFVVYYLKEGHKRKYFNQNGILQKTIKTATALGEDYREQFESACKENETMFIKDIEASPMAEAMYQNNAIQYNKIAW